MNAKPFLVIALCIAAVLIAGCAGYPSMPKAPAAPATTPAVTTAPADARSCTAVEDCVPAQSCHPTSCVNRNFAPSGGPTACTMSCETPLDCGAGSCGCVNGQCGVVPATGR